MNTRNIAVDEPSELIDEMIKQQRLLLSGFKGYEDVNMKKWKEAQNPSNVALSLIGESLLYSKLSEILKEFHKKDFTSFLVTKGTLPEKLAKLEEEPTNLYISLCAPDKETYKKIDRPLTSKSWEKQMKSLELMKSFSCRKVIRLTLVKGWNMKTPEKYANLIKRAEPDFLEPKAYMHVGESQKRLPREAMPTMEEVRKFAKELSDSTGFKIKDEDTSSKIVLLANKN
jgi:tRNA wybutosine-synthesizing protein 1